MLILEEIGQFIGLCWSAFWYWWWLLTFLFFQGRFRFYWKWWRNELWFNTVWKPVLLEIKIPKELPKPIKAMEAVLVAIHGGLFNDPDWWELYVSGEPQTSVKFEMTSIDGRIHFYIRCHSDYRDIVEAAVYSQYPEAEIEAVPDYTKQVPMDLPNKEWDMFGWDYYMLQPPQFPIPTHTVYSEEGKVEEEEKIDPLTSLLEGMAKLKPGEQMWIQIHARPMYTSMPEGEAFVKKAEHLRDVLAKRIDVNSAASKPILHEVLDFALYGAKEEEEKPQELFPAEMRLTTGERERIDAVEQKAAKPLFTCWIRTIYLGKRDTWYLPNRRLIYNYFNNFVNPDINSLWIWLKTMTRVKLSPIPFINAVADRRAYVKKRHLLRVYRERLNYYSPWGPKEGDKGLQMVMNVEELATLFHFPSHIIAPTPGIQRTEAKETVAPHNLPT
ncbi:MAG: hypothetical protein MUD10_02215 [Candidatus Pacebacteria bacterium]|jgi:hypothetical protein|nr:hypothetical protein [Candidatus Paceibacterota bacterium]